MSRNCIVSSFVKIFRDEIDVGFTRQLDRFQDLDDHARNVFETLSAQNESVLAALPTESSKSDERIHATFDVIVAKQDETNTEVIETLQALDSTSRAEQVATRQELEQLKQALVQIRKDLIERDEEHQEILLELSRAYAGTERKRLQERSNAVAVAIYALVTIYEGLQVPKQSFFQTVQY